MTRIQIQMILLPPTRIIPSEVQLPKKQLKVRGNGCPNLAAFLPEIRTPDQLESGWQYRLSITVGQQAVWTNDDSTLRVEALKDVDRISKVIRRVRAAKEID